jgi:DNA recombination protein RmuC
MIEPVSLTIGVLAGAAAMLIAWLASRSRQAAHLARVEAERDAALRAAAEQRELATSTRAEARDTFASLSREALKDNRADFLHTADALLAPVRATLDKVQAQLSAVDKAREGTFQSVAAQLKSLAHTQEQLRTATEGLTRSLKSPNVRGKWGEIQLRRILELAGMLHHCDFVEKESVLNPDGQRLTPDLIVRLPGGTSIVVDSKVPIEAYLAAAQAQTEAEREQHLTQHARQVREHLRSLGAKEYWRQFEPAPEFVVMFLPLEPLMASAFEQDGTLLEHGASLRVIPATPMTLLALLKAVGYGWQQHDVAKNAEEIRTLGRDLYERLATLVDHLDRMGLNIRQTVASYNKAVGSLQQKVFPAARRFRDLGVAAGRSIDEPEPITTPVRQMRSRTDLLGAAEEPEADAAADDPRS